MELQLENIKIYKIISIHSDKCYIGCTTQSLKRRLSNHYNAYRRYLLNKSEYVTSFELLQLGDCSIHLIENIPSATKFDMHAREAYYITTMLNTVNKVIPNRTAYEYNRVLHLCTVCGLSCQIKNRSRHFNTKLHKNNEIQQLENEFELFIN
jgi:hypothetical protein